MIDCANPLNRSCWLNRGLLCDITYIPGLANANQTSTTGAGNQGGVVHDLTRLPGGVVGSSDGLQQNGVHASFGAGISWKTGPTRPGGFGKSLSFPGDSSNFLVLGRAGFADAPLNFTKTDTVAAFCWVYARSNSAVAKLLSVHDISGNLRWGLQLRPESNPAPTFGIYDSSFTNLIEGENTAGFPIKTWTHVGFSYDGSVAVGGIKLYVNGESKTVSTNGNDDPGALNCLRPYVGISFDGLLDQLRVYNRVVPPVEAKALQAESLAGSRNLYRRSRASAWSSLAGLSGRRRRSRLLLLGAG